MGILLESSNGKSDLMACVGPRVLFDFMYGRLVEFLTTIPYNEDFEISDKYKSYLLDLYDDDTLSDVKKRILKDLNEGVSENMYGDADIMRFLYKNTLFLNVLCVQGVITAFPLTQGKEFFSNSECRAIRRALRVLENGCKKFGKWTDGDQEDYDRYMIVFDDALTTQDGFVTIG